MERLAELGAPHDPRAYRVDGLEPLVALAPETPEAVAEALAVCAAAGLVVIPWGGGRQMGLGNLPERYDVALDVRSLSAITHYEPDDLTIAVQAGRSIASLSSELAAHGQMLPIEAADPERVTIGGLVATGIGCPRRFGYGSLRDLIIGITVALPDGTLARGGGIVVKNVSGYDMMRLHFGALGSLGVIIQANFKVLPAPEAQRTLLLSFRESDQSAAAALTLRTSQLAPTALVVLAPPVAKRLADLERWVLAARCEGPRERSSAKSSACERAWRQRAASRSCSMTARRWPSGRRCRENWKRRRSIANFGCGSVSCRLGSANWQRASSAVMAAHCAASSSTAGADWPTRRSVESRSSSVLSGVNCASWADTRRSWVRRSRSRQERMSSGDIRRESRSCADSRRRSTPSASSTAGDSSSISEHGARRHR
jgi:hypothetical protein